MHICQDIIKISLINTVTVSENCRNRINCHQMLLFRRFIILENNFPNHEYNRIKNMQGPIFEERRQFSLKKQNKKRVRKNCPIRC